MEIKNLPNAILGLTTATIMLAVASTASADEKATVMERMTLGYAAETETTDKRFEQFNFDHQPGYEMHGSYDDAHEMNDAWLGMPVRDTFGNLVGYVEDAFLDQDGYLEHLLVGINGSKITVSVDQKHVEYSEVAVLIDMPMQAIAALSANQE